MSFDFLILGGGVFGIFSAIELRRRKYKVLLLNPGSIPHHLAASTDISKAVRMEYGSDQEYFKMAELSIDQWKIWNETLGSRIYHEVGFLMLCKDKLGSDPESYEYQSYQNLVKFDYQPEVLDNRMIEEKYPEVHHEAYNAAVYNPHGGYVESGRAIELLADYARSIGVVIREGEAAREINNDGGKVTGVTTDTNQTHHCAHVIVAAGAHTPLLLPELRPYFKITGHPVFWLKPENVVKFKSPHLPVFMADIAHTGWYGFPFHDELGIIKIAKHSDGIVIHPDLDERRVTDHDLADMRQFVTNSFPNLVQAPVVYTRRCLYTDTLDGHFWIDRHPEIEGLTVSTGGSGHGMKMGPMLGVMTADKAEGKEHFFSDRYNWRILDDRTEQTEEARYLIDRKK